MTDTTIPNTALDAPANLGGQIMEKVNGVISWFVSHAVEIVWDVIVIVAIILLARLVLALVSSLTKAAMEKEKYHKTEAQGKHIDTMMTLIRSMSRYGIYFVAILLIFMQLDLEGWMKGILTAAGIGSLALGIGAQSFVKDVATGFFMMFENQMAVGDYVRIDDIEGYVEAVAVRVTYLRGWRGEQYILSNGAISRVINYSRGNSLAVIFFTTAYQTDTQEVLLIIMQGLKRFAAEHADLVVEPPYIRGVTNTTLSGVEISCACKVKPLKFWEAERYMRLAVKEELERSRVQNPYPFVITGSTTDCMPQHPEMPDPTPPCDEAAS